MQGHLLQKHLHVQQAPSQLRCRRSCRITWLTLPQRQCQHTPCTRLPALPAQPAAAGQHQQQLEGQGPGSGSSGSQLVQLVQLVEVQDRRRTTYSWQNSSTSNSSSNGSSVTVQHEQQEEEHREQPLLPLLPGRQQLLDALKALYLPAGYPNTVTDDYLAYQLYTVPAHITGWLSISLTTSSLFKAVGISAGPVGATAAAAAIKWIIKDGIGAAGRLLVGGRLGVEFDDDPRRWRMAAEALTTAGLAMEIATAVFPSHFLLLASLGNFSKAVGKGMGRPVFRVIQNHFAAAGNVGAVAAKEEVWEVTAQLTGYALSVLLLQALQDTGSWQKVVGIWALVQGMHVAARYLALRQLRFRYLNQKRAGLLVRAHVRGRAVPSIAACNQMEPLLLPASAMQPAITFGCSLEQAWGCDVAQLQPQQLADWVQLYEQQGYLLVWREGHAYVVIKQDCKQLQQALLRAIWQAAWLDSNTVATQQPLQQQQQRQQQQCSNTALLKSSLDALDGQFGEFLQEAHGLGWNTDVGVFRVGKTRVVL